VRFYLDTSALIKLYYPEAESDSLSTWILSVGRPILFTSLHELELRNAFALKLFRNEVSENENRMLGKTIEKDLKEGVLTRIHPQWGMVFQKGLELSNDYTKQTGSRSLDILHVAIAKVMECTHIITFDDRQRSLATKALLELVAV